MIFLLILECRVQLSYPMIQQIGHIRNLASRNREWGGIRCPGPLHGSITGPEGCDGLGCRGASARI